jgi:hypothetical protein
MGAREEWVVAGKASLSVHIWIPKEEIRKWSAGAAVTETRYLCGATQS